MMVLCSGPALVLAVVLSYIMIWRPRKDNAQAVAESEFDGYSAARWYVSFMPWILTLTFVTVLVFGIFYAADSIMNPPNW